MTERSRILWADDEIDLLKAHVMFLTQKGYEVITTNNGFEALELIEQQEFDIVFLDENMPGLTGIETLEKIKQLFPHLPVVMVTKSEEEHIMEEAIGSRIADYLIKPVNPNQLLLAVKKNLEKKELVIQKTNISYQQEFRAIGMEISNRLDFTQWIEIYKKIIGWEIRLTQSGDSSMMEVLKQQKEEANQVFTKYIEQNYANWVKPTTSNKPIMSHTLLKEKLFPLTQSNENLAFILIDNLRFDQWKTIQPLIEEFYRLESEDLYYAILPTVTQFARNSLFSGLMPSEIAKKYPQWWLNDWDEGTKNQYEEELLGENLKRYGKDIRFSFNKVLNLNVGKKLADSVSDLSTYKLNVIIYNFVDMLSHARTEMEIIRELADDEPAYRSLTQSWFEHSPLFDIIRQLALKRIPIIITTDHGSIRVQNPVKIIGDRQTNTNLRFKVGKNLNYNKKEAFSIAIPEEIFLPKPSLSSSVVFAKNYDFFAYPNNYNYYANYYKNTFQHGGISMEEMLVPFIYLKPR